MLGGTIEEDFINEEGEEEYIVTPKFASTLLNGDEFYGEKKIIILLKRKINLQKLKKILLMLK